MILITKIKNSKEINKNLLKLINEIKNPYSEGLFSNISNTDWNLQKEQNKKHIEYFFKIIRPYMDKIAFKLKSKNWQIHNCWFQQYLKSDYHQWHTHPSTNFSNVYFIELPNKLLATEILKHKKLNIKEGYLLTFPGYLYHRSPVNKSKKRKTIISFNSSFYDFNEKIQ